MCSAQKAHAYYLSRACSDTVGGGRGGGVTLLRGGGYSVYFMLRCVSGLCAPPLHSLTPLRNTHISRPRQVACASFILFYFYFFSLALPSTLSRVFSETHTSVAAGTRLVLFTTDTVPNLLLLKVLRCMQASPKQTFELRPRHHSQLPSLTPSRPAHYSPTKAPPAASGGAAGMLSYVAAVCCRMLPYADVC
jgi:hypothetical protein